MFRVFFILNTGEPMPNGRVILGESTMPIVPRIGEAVGREVLDSEVPGVLPAGKLTGRFDQSLIVEEVTHGRNETGWYHSLVVRPSEMEYESQYEGE